MDTSVAGVENDISLDELHPTQVGTAGTEGPSWVWARIPSEELPRVNASDVRAALPQQVAKVTTAFLRRLIAEALKVVPREVSEETIIHQHSGLLDSELYRQLANAGAFPSRKRGKRIFARWGDVRAALLPGAPTEPEPSGPKPSPDDLRMRWGLAPTGRR
ncbi:MAG TPA: hypothetical protein VHC69_16005 [Polyangiaceae bacterium]|nr:hypothetical protein [Polyangiaceae bacterium]